MKTGKVRKKLLLEAGYCLSRSFSAPEFVSLLITYRCNFKCKNCDIWKTACEELSDEEWLKIADKIKKSLPRETFIEINGGEPLMRKKLTLDLIKSLKEKFDAVGINSNGYLIDNQIAQEIKKAKADFVKISLYSLAPRIHDQMRGLAGSHQSARQAIDILKKNGIPMEIGILIAQDNIMEIPGLIEELAKSGGNFSVILQPLDETIESGNSKIRSNNFISEEQWPGEKEISELFEKLEKYRRWIKNWASAGLIKEYYLNPENILRNRCFVGQRNLVVYPNGETAFCFKGKKLGNLKEDGLKNILNSKEARKERHWIKKCRKYCRVIGCNYAKGIKEFLDFRR